MKTWALLLLLILPGVAWGQSSGPAKYLAQRWGCDPARADSVLTLARVAFKGRGVPVPRVGELGCTALARIGGYPRYTQVNNRRIVHIGRNRYFVLEHRETRPDAPVDFSELSSTGVVLFNRTWVVTDVVWRQP